MLGLGIGSLAGGRLSARFPRRAILIFGIAELCVAAFGLFSLRIFEWAAVHTAGANLPSVIFFSLLLLLIPTILMGRHASLFWWSISSCTRTGWARRFPRCILRIRLVRRSPATSARRFFLRDFGQSGSVGIAACLNALVGGDCLSLFPARKRKHPNDLAVSAKLGCRVHHSGNVAGRPVRFHCPGI